MRRFLVFAALAASTLAVAAPAAAQWQQPAAYGNGYGHNGNYGQFRRLQAQVDNLQRRIVQLDRRNIISEREARSLMGEARTIEYRLRKNSRNGLSIREQRDIQYRVARLEQRISREARDGNRYASNGRHTNGFIDRDRDGRDDRFEDDRGHRHD